MSKIATDGISTIWMSTGADSLKTIDFLANPKAGLCFQDKGRQRSLNGNGGSGNRREDETRTLAGLVYRTFSGGPTDPGYVLLKFESNHATYWIEGTFIHKKLD